MPKLNCLCGYAINLSQIPNSQGFFIVSEMVLENLVANLVNSYKKSSSKEEFERQAFANFHLKTPGIAQAYECPNCRRLIIFGRASDAIPDLWFHLEKANDEVKASSLGSLINKVAGTNTNSDE